MTGLAILLAAGLIVGAAPSETTAGEVDSKPRPGPTCPQRSDVADLERRRSAAENALRQLEAAHTFRLRALDEAPATHPQQAERDLEALLLSNRRARERVLEPLAQRGDPEAMMRLAADLRDSTAPEEVARWLNLVTCAAERGQPQAHDELTRWFWHQQGDGSVDAVQENRARALDHAAKAAAAGEWFALSRIAIYIAGDVHQYPPSLPLARGLMTLCARGGGALCQEVLAGGSAYDFDQSPAQRFVWLTLLAERQPQRFAARRDRVRAELSPEDVADAQRVLSGWRASPWAELQPEWRQVRRAILAHGGTSAGTLRACTTATPWCRGR